MAVKRALLLLFLFLCFLVPLPARAQQQAAPAPAPSSGGGGGFAFGGSGRNPPMRNVFLNVLWGSFTTGMVYVSWNFLDNTRTKGERYSFSQITAKFVEGATYGSVVGLATGGYLSLAKISFDPGRARIGA